MVRIKLGVLIIILSLFFVINDNGGFWRYSPAIFGAATLVLIKSLNLSARFFHLGLVSGRNLILFFIMFCCILSSYFTYDLSFELRAVGQSIYILGCLIACEYAVKYSLHKTLLFTFTVIVCIDMIIRVLINFPSTEMYDYKMSMILVDTNFIAQLLLVSIMPFVWYRRPSSVLLMISTFSRSVWIVFLLYLMKRWWYFIAVIITFSAIIVGQRVDLADLDGSFSTKLDIAHSFILVANYDILNLLFGYGKIGVFEALDNLGYQGTVGHTLFGVIIELGFIQILLGFIAVNISIPLGYRRHFWAVIFIVGVLSLYPVSYLGLLALVYNCALHVSGVCGHKNNKCVTKT